MQATNAGDGSCCICFEPLPSAAVIQLACPGAHFVHLSCAIKRLQVGVNTQTIAADTSTVNVCAAGLLCHGRLQQLVVMQVPCW